MSHKDLNKWIMMMNDYFLIILKHQSRNCFFKSRKSIKCYFYTVRYFQASLCPLYWNISVFRSVKKSPLTNWAAWPRTLTIQTWLRGTSASRLQYTRLLRGPCPVCLSAYFCFNVCLYVLFCIFKCLYVFMIVCVSVCMTVCLYLDSFLADLWCCTFVEPVKDVVKSFGKVKSSEGKEIQTPKSRIIIKR